MVIEFDPQCGTAQPEDTLQLFVPACRRPDAVPQPSVNLNEDGEPVCKVAYWPILKKFYGTNNWPKASVVIPGKICIYGKCSKIIITIFCKKDLHKQHRPRSDCF